MSALKKEIDLRQFLREMQVVNPSVSKFMKMTMPTVATLPIEALNDWTSHAILQKAEKERNPNYIIKVYEPSGDVLKAQLHLPKIKNGVVNKTELINYVYNKAQREGRNIDRETIEVLLNRNDWAVLKASNGYYPIILSKVEEILHSL